MRGNLQLERSLLIAYLTIFSLLDILFPSYLKDKIVAIKCPKSHFDNPDDTIYCGKCAAPFKPSEEVSVPCNDIEFPHLGTSSMI